MGIRERLRSNRKPMTKDRIINLVSILLVTFLSLAMGWMYGYYQGTGTFPLTVSKTVLTPEIETTISSEDVEEFLENTSVDLGEYGVDSNCVESAILLSRAAAWYGLEAYIIELDFLDSDTGHLILGFVTEDDGWVFIEPSTSEQVYPVEGGQYSGYTIEAMYALDIYYNLIPLETIMEEN